MFDKQTARIVAAIIDAHLTTSLAVTRDLGIAEVVRLRAQGLANDLKYLATGVSPFVTQEDIARYELYCDRGHDALVTSFNRWGVDEEFTGAALEGHAHRRALTVEFMQTLVR